MSDRYQTTTREVPVDQPRNTVYATTGAATGDLNSQHRVTEHPAGFRVRERGALEGTVVHAYRCPVHGEFEARVPRSEVPDETTCPRKLVSIGDFDAIIGGPALKWSEVPGWPHDVVCGTVSPWAGSSCGIGRSSGEVTC